MGEAELCDREGFLSDGTSIAVGSPNELRRRASDGEFIQLPLGGDSGDLGARLEVLEKIGRWWRSGGGTKRQKKP